MRSRWNPKGYANKVEPSEHDLPPPVEYVECDGCGDYWHPDQMNCDSLDLCPTCNN